MSRWWRRHRVAMLSLLVRAALGVGDHVVQVAGLGGAGAPREHTGQVPFGCLGGEPVGDLVLVDMDVLGQVDHRPHRHRGAGAAAPGADLVGVDEASGCSPPGPGAASRPGAVIASSERWTCSTTSRPGAWAGVGLGPGVEVQRQLVAGHLPEGFGAAHVQRRGRAEVGEPGGAGREGGVEVQGVGEVDLGLAPTRCPRRTPDRCARGRAGRPRRPPGGAGPPRA